MGCEPVFAGRNRYFKRLLTLLSGFKCLSNVNKRMYEFFEFAFNFKFKKTKIKLMVKVHIIMLDVRDERDGEREKGGGGGGGGEQGEQKTREGRRERDEEVIFALEQCSVHQFIPVYKRLTVIFLLRCSSLYLA